MKPRSLRCGMGREYMMWLLDRSVGIRERWCSREKGRFSGNAAAKKTQEAMTVERSAATRAGALAGGQPRALTAALLRGTRAISVASRRTGANEEPTQVPRQSPPGTARAGLTSSAASG